MKTFAFAKYNFFLHFVTVLLINEVPLQKNSEFIQIP